MCLFVCWDINLIVYLFIYAGFLDQICHLHKRLYEYDPRATITEINDEDNNEKENGQVMRLQ